MKTIEITNGPSREELFDGLRLFTEKRFVKFTVLDSSWEIPTEILLQGIQAEDGSGQNWNLTIFIDDYFTKNRIPILAFRNLVNPIRKAKAFYSTNTRKGVITVG